MSEAGAFTAALGAFSEARAPRDEDWGAVLLRLEALVCAARADPSCVRGGGGGGGPGVGSAFALLLAAPHAARLGPAAALGVLELVEAAVVSAEDALALARCSGLPPLEVLALVLLGAVDSGGGDEAMGEVATAALRTLARLLTVLPVADPSPAFKRVLHLALDFLAAPPPAAGGRATPRRRGAAHVHAHAAACGLRLSVLAWAARQSVGCRVAVRESPSAAGAVAAAEALLGGGGARGGGGGGGPAGEAPVAAALFLLHAARGDGGSVRDGGGGGAAVASEALALGLHAGLASLAAAARGEQGGGAAAHVHLSTALALVADMAAAGVPASDGERGVVQLCVGSLARGGGGDGALVGARLLREATRAGGDHLDAARAALSASGGAGLTALLRVIAAG